MTTDLSSLLRLTAFAGAAFTAFLVSPEIGGPVLFYGGLAAIFLPDYARTRRTLPVEKVRVLQVNLRAEPLKLAA